MKYILVDGSAGLYLLGFAKKIYSIRDEEVLNVKMPILIWKDLYQIFSKLTSDVCVMAFHARIQNFQVCRWLKSKIYKWIAKRDALYA